MDTTVWSDQMQIAISILGWLVGCVGFNGSLRQYFSLYTWFIFPNLIVHMQNLVHVCT